ncbi:hypothetical protein E6C70_11760 [Glaciibacter flavus]|uniref:Glyoxalase n=1 Tax=Orlajensenia flava TaxID=2565934 RepID=A0A4S4FQ47_9MICO|nr:hypothetical protein [Glaciibacter flavus]THG32444.1 hypothetical protein E6C70_11760 [Glaciibacter flavus]
MRSLLGIIVTDMPAVVRFYRLVGLDIPVSADGKRFVHRMGSGATLFLDTVFARGVDAGHVRQTAGYALGVRGGDA